MNWRTFATIYLGHALLALGINYVSADRFNASTCHVRICGFERP